MLKTKLWTIAAILLVLATVLCLPRFTSRAQTDAKQSAADAATLQTLAGYREWTRVNRDPVILVRSNNFTLDGAGD